MLSCNGPTGDITNQWLPWDPHTRLMKCYSKQAADDHAAKGLTKTDSFTFGCMSIQLDWSRTCWTTDWYRYLVEKPQCTIPWIYSIADHGWPPTPGKVSLPQGFSEFSSETSTILLAFTICPISTFQFSTHGLGFSFPPLSLSCLLFTYLSK